MAGEHPDCDICGQPYHRHMEIFGAGLMCPVSAVCYRPKRAASGIETREGGDPAEGRRAEHESPAPKGDAQ